VIVRSYMSSPPIVTQPQAPISEALKLMRDRHIRRLPVLDGSGRLVGIVSDRDLLHAEPSPATSLSVWEITYLLSRITVDTVMTRDVVTVTPDTPLEHAAQLMCERKIGGLPVMDRDVVVGVITETDVFRVFTQLLGAGEPGVAVTAFALDRQGLLADVTRAIADAGGDVRAIASYPPQTAEAAPERAVETAIFIKVSGVTFDLLAAAVRPFVERIEEQRS